MDKYTAIKKIQFFPSGDSSEEVAQDLENLLQRWLKNPVPTSNSQNKKEKTLGIEITDPKRSTSVEQCVSYACSEIRNGIGYAGGKIWDGTHIMIYIPKEN